MQSGRNSIHAFVLINYKCSEEYGYKLGLQMPWYFHITNAVTINRKLQMQWLSFQRLQMQSRSVTNAVAKSVTNACVPLKFPLIRRKMRFSPQRITNSNISFIVNVENKQKCLLHSEKGNNKHMPIRVCTNPHFFQKCQQGHSS